MLAGPQILELSANDATAAVQKQMIQSIFKKKEDRVLAGGRFIPPQYVLLSCDDQKSLWTVVKKAAALLSLQMRSEYSGRQCKSHLGYLGSFTPFIAVQFSKLIDKRQDH